MEDIVQRVFAIIFAVIVFFVMPIYMTFEKRDDISYALAVKITSNFVNTVKSKGYLTAKMYSDFVSELGATNNVYEIKMEHRVKKYNPVINIYDSDDNVVEILDYELYKTQFDGGNCEKLIVNNYNSSTGEIEPNKYEASKGYKFKLTYKLGEIIFNEEQIIENLNQENIENSNYFKMSEDYYKENISKEDIPVVPLTYMTKDGSAIYKMSVGDEFTVTIRNTNSTLASVLFDALTFNGITSDMPRVYINYGCQIKNQEYTELAEVN